MASSTFFPSPKLTRYDESPKWTEIELKEFIAKYWEGKHDEKGYTLEEEIELYNILKNLLDDLDPSNPSIDLPTDLSEKYGNEQHGKILADMASDYAVLALDLHKEKVIVLTKEKLSDMYNIAIELYRDYFPSEVDSERLKKAEALAELNAYQPHPKKHKQESKKRKASEDTQEVSQKDKYKKRRLDEKEKASSFVEEKYGYSKNPAGKM